jgi:ornithine cyclodeaminase/alanine dehydrogenase-like protein (mu-crystallin family)
LHIDATFATPSPPPPWFGAVELAALLPIARAIEALERALVQEAERAASAHAALAYELPAGVLHAKLAALGGERPVVAAKLNANFPDNPERGLPTIQGVEALFDAADGRLLALLDSPELTALRTGAATAVAARRLARPESRRLLVGGAGRQAFAQAAALAAVLPLQEAVVADLEPARALALALRLRDELGLEARVAPEVAAAAPGCDVVVTCTTSRAPILGLADVTRGSFVAAVGADHPSKQELAPTLVAASRLFVDSPEQALAAGELHHAVVAGAIRADGFAGRLDQLVTGEVAGHRSADEITLFDSTGIALEDAAAALAAYEEWLARSEERTK